MVLSQMELWERGLSKHTKTIPFSLSQIKEIGPIITYPLKTGMASTLELALVPLKRPLSMNSTTQSAICIVHAAMINLTKIVLRLLKAS